MVQTGSIPTPLVASKPPTPPTHLTILAALAEDGSISASTLCRLATLVSSGEDKTFISSVEAILPLKTISPEVFSKALHSLLVERGIDNESLNETEKINTKQPDAIAATSTSIDHADSRDEPKEIIAICIDTSGSMQTPFEVDDDIRTVDRDRLQAVKQCFYGFRDQTQAYEDSHLLGLLSFNNTVIIHTNPTKNFDVFEDVIDDMAASGSTAIYEAVVVACNKVLGPFASKYHSANLRVLVLSDGQNNSHNVNADDALRALANVGAVCDCMIIGGSSNSADDGLRRLVAASEGVCVEIAGLSDAFEALESSAMISLANRRTGEPKFNKDVFRQKMAELSSVNAVAVAPMKRGAVSKMHKNTAETTKSSVPLEIALKNPNISSSNTRVLKELQDISQSNLENFRVFPNVYESGLISMTINVVFVGQKKHIAYGGRAFLLSIEFPSDYPFKPFHLNFVTPIYHYAVKTDGSICLPILHDEWSPALSLRKVLVELDLLLHNPRSADPNCNLALRSWLSDLLRTDPDRYFNDASEHSSKNAKKASNELDAASLLRLFS